MNKKTIKIEQVLHGYSHGHHLLVGSIELSKYSQRTMSILSDLSGPEVYENFSEYITGYPLVDDNYYALGKTWYASEMKRPGCVWTHTLLVHFDDIKKIGDVTILLEYFSRPQKDFNKNDYSSSIEFNRCIDSVNNINFSNTTANELRYLLWSIYSDRKPIVLPSETAGEYEKLILLVWQNQWPKLHRVFSFCTGSLANRKLGSKTFDIQIVPYSLSKSIGRANPKSIVLDENQMKASLSGYPEWVSLAANEILYESTGKFKEFLEDFGVAFEEKIYFNKLAQLYIETDARNCIITIDKFMAIAKSVFKSNDSKSLIKYTLEQLLNFFPNKWFKYTDFSLFLQELSIKRDLDRVGLNKSQIKARLKSLWESNKDNAKELFKGLISKDLNKFGELLLKDFSQLIQPEQLPVLTDMDLGACNVLVSFRPKFALCTEIWHQPKDFQCEILDCIDKEILSEALSKNIVETILENSSEVLYKQVFSVFGETSIKIVLNWCRISTPQNKKMEKWINICKCSPKTCLNWIASTVAVDANLLVSIIPVLDPYSEVVRHNGIKPWLRVFKQLNQKDINTNSKLALAQFFLPLILTSNETVAEDFVEFSFTPIHDKLAKNQLGYERWTKLESILPSAPWYSSWDKCKRLRRAMKEKGYSVRSSGYSW